MKQFLIKITIYLLPVLFGLCFIELFLRFIPNDYKYKRQCFMEETNNIQILVLGSSHANLGIDPNYFSLNGFNFSNISQSLDLDYELLKKYGKLLDKLEFVVIPISYFSMTSCLSKGSENWRIKNYNLYYDINMDNNSIKKHFEILNGTMFSNLYRIYSFFRNNESLITVSNRGFGLNHKANVKNDLEETGKAAALRHTHNNNDMYIYNKNIINKIIEWCKNNNVKLIFVTFPAYYTYRNKLDNNQLNETIIYMEYIDTNYNFVYYYNLIEDNKFTEEHYFDADHLNELGAAKLTKIIDDIIVSIR